MADERNRFPENSSEIAQDLVWISAAPLLMFALAPLMLVIEFTLPAVLFPYTATSLCIAGGLIGYGVAFVYVWNVLRPIQVGIDAAFADFRNSRRRKLALVDSINSLAHRLANEEYAIHGGIARNARDAAAEIARGNSAAIVLANLAVQYPALTSSDAFQKAQANAAIVEQSIDEDLRRLHKMISSWNEIVTLFPLNQFYLPSLGLRPIQPLSDENIDERTSTPTIKSE